MLKDLLALGDKETTNFLNSALLLKQVSILKLDSMLWVVTHQVLCKEDAWVEPYTNAWVNFIYESMKIMMLGLIVIRESYEWVCFLLLTLTFFVC